MVNGHRQPMLIVSCKVKIIYLKKKIFLMQMEMAKKHEHLSASYEAVGVLCLCGSF